MSIGEDTKKVYIDQHKNYLKDKDLFRRHYEYSIEESTYCLSKGWFKEKDVLDIGCGNNLVREKALYDMGCKSITCLDIGETWISLLKEAISDANMSLNRFKFVPGSICNMPIDSNSFDFVGAFGILMHLESLDSMNIALEEMMRVTRPGGICNAYFGCSSTGILDKYIHKALREAYKNEKEFKEYIDCLSVKEVRADLTGILQKGQNKDAFITKELINAICQLVTLDSTTYFQNLLQVPVQLGADLDEGKVKEMLANVGAIDVQRCPDYYYQRKDFRRLLTPFHMSREESNYCRIMFGEGHIKMTWRKAK